MSDITARLKQACVGNPYAKIAWPHRILHEAADTIAALRQQLEEAQRQRDLAIPATARLVERCESYERQLAEAEAQEPFGYFRHTVDGWEDCAESDDGAVALYERPQAERSHHGEGALEGE